MPQKAFALLKAEPELCAAASVEDPLQPLTHTPRLVQSHPGSYSRTTVGQPYSTVLGGYTNVVEGKPAWWLFQEFHS